MKTAKILTAAVIFVMFTFLLPVYAAEVKEAETYESTENEIVKLFNNERENLGMPALEQDETLTKLARQKAQEMADKGSEKVDFKESIKGFLEENSVKSKSRTYFWVKGKKTSAEVVKEWSEQMNFDRDLWADEKTAHIGVGVVKANNGQMYYYYIAAKLFEEADQKVLEDEVIRLINEERGKRGLTLVTKNKELSKVARIKAEDMAEKDYADHKSPTYGYPDKMVKDITGISGPVGENSAAGQSTAAEVFKAWMDSPGHEAHLMNERVTEIGVGVGINENGRYYWSMMSFGGSYVWGE
jgi:uncharacterized protein YkwD